MTNEELQGHIKALNDAAASGEIEFGTGSDWGTTAQILTATLYRIKPKPREAWIK